MDSTNKTDQDAEKGIVPGADDSPDPSSKMWALCILQANEHDPAMVKGWKADMDGFFIYTSVFSVTVAAFVIESVKLLQPDSSAVTAQLLRQATQQLAAISNGVHLVTPPTTDDAFRPPRYAVRVNILWFLSLCLGLSCALLATLVQQWARRYLRLTHTDTRPMFCVRTRTYLFHGVESFHIRWVIENISLLMQAAIFLFFAGLVEFLFAINHEVATVILVTVCIFGAVYISLTAFPVLYYYCPYQTPLTSLIWYTGHYLSIGALWLFSYSKRIQDTIQRLRDNIHKGYYNHLADIAKYDEELQIDEKALKWALTSCSDDSQLETFVDAIPGYLRGGKKSYRIKNIKSLLNKPMNDPHDPQLSPHLDLLLTSCVDADIGMDKGLRRQRAITCARAIGEISKASADLMTYLPVATCRKLRHLSGDHDPVIALEALSALAIAEHTLLARFDGKKDLERHTDASQVLNAIVGERQHHHDHGPSDRRLLIVTDFISRVFSLIPLMEKLSYEDLEAIRKTLERLCDALDREEFSLEARRKFAEKLAEMMRGEAEVKPEGQQFSRSPISAFQKIVENATSEVVNALEVEFNDLLSKS
ncbi:hypothetical protein BGW80DRAFT_420417 [Lactifluus volemus]|nr:hypothetical protein BGW80DRAFT_420417 [Lactifluus volemus]